MARGNSWTAGEDRERRAVLLCFESDGRVRWQRTLDDRVRFGDLTFVPPWLVYHIKTTPDAAGTRSTWVVYTHGMLFPSVLERLGPNGTLLTRHWSNGYIEFVTEATWHGRQVLLVGGANNEHKGASLAILDPRRSSAAPAANREYRCTSCPAGDPLAFVVFPPSPVLQVRGGENYVESAWIDGRDRVVVSVAQPAPDGAPLPRGFTIHTLGPDLVPQSIEVSAKYLQLHNYLFGLGRIHHPYSGHDDDDLATVLTWDGDSFMPMRMRPATAGLKAPTGN